MEQVGEQLDAVDQSRTGAREGRGRVDREDALRPERLDLVPVLERLRAGSLRIPTTRHRDRDVGVES